MDQRTSSSSLLSSLFVPFLLFVFFVLLKLFRNSKPNKSKLKSLPPGPWKLPIIGNIHQLIGSQPHHALRDLAKKHGPIMQLQLGQVPHVVFSSPEAAKEVLKTHDLALANRPYTFASSVFTYDHCDIAFARGGKWAQLRKICALELLGTKRVQSFRSVREEEIASMLGSIAAASSAGEGAVNLGLMLRSFMSNMMSRTLFGETCEQKDLLLGLMKRALKALEGFSVVDLFPSMGFLHVITGERAKIIKLGRELDKVLESIIGDRRARRARLGARNDGDNLLDVLLNLQEGGDLEFPLTTNSIKAVFFDLFSAGVDTVASTIEWAMAELSRNPSIMEKVQSEVRRAPDTIPETSIQEMKYLNAIIKETLRLYPPGPLLIPREAGYGVEINGFEVPAETKVLVNAWAIGRDPDLWPKPERFWPERFVDSPVDHRGAHFEFIPFGSGRRICPGMLYGLTTTEYVLASLLYDFDWNLPKGMAPKDMDMSDEFTLTLGKKIPLTLIAKPWHPESSADLGVKCHANL